MNPKSPIELGSGSGCDGDEQEQDKLGLGLGLSPVSSRYSSCEDSEFDRYCSATCALGTPSSVSCSIGYYNHDLGSDFEGFKLGGSRVVSRFFEGEAKGKEISDKKEDLAVILKNVESVLLQGAVAARSVADDLMVCRDDDDADEMVDYGCRELDESSSRCDHSDGEDSMFGYGSSDDVHDHDRYRVYSVGNVGGHDQQDDGGVGSLMVMNTSVAFGANDWEEFELDGMENVKESNEDLWVRSPVGCDEIDSPDLNLMGCTPVERFQWREEELSERNVAMDNNDELEVDKSLKCSVSSITKATETKAIESSGGGLGRQRLGCEDETNSPDLNFMRCCPVEKFQWRKEELSERNVASDNNDSLSSIAKTTETKDIGRSEDVLGRQRLITSNDETYDYLENCSVYDVFQERSPTEHDVGKNVSVMREEERKNLDITARDVSSGHDDLAVPLHCLNSAPHFLAGEDQLSSAVHEDAKLDAFGVQGVRLETSPEGNLSNSALTLLESEEGRMCGDAHLHDGQNSSSQAKGFGMNDLYDEFVLDMEEILLESCGSSGITLKQKHSEFQYDQSSSLRSGESISSSGFVDGNLLNHHSLRIDKVEVVGAKQKRGDISLSE